MPINRVTITQPATGSTLTIADGKTLTVTQDTSLDEAVAMSSKAPKTSVIVGDGSAGITLRIIYFYIEDGTDANTIKVTSASRWNGDANGPEDNLGKSGDTGMFTLGANGNLLTLEDAGITGSCVGVISSDLVSNGTGDSVRVNSYAGGGIALNFSDATLGTNYDLTTIGPGETITVNVAYLSG